MLTTKPALCTLELVDMPAAVTDQAVAHVPTLTTLQVNVCVSVYSEGLRQCAGLSQRMVGPHSLSHTVLAGSISESEEGEGEELPRPLCSSRLSSLSSARWS